jgi:hypothetical protein
MLRCLCVQMGRITAPFTPEDVAECLYGMQGMYSLHAEVREVLSALKLKLQSSHSPISPRVLSRMLFGLQNMKCGAVEVRDLLAVIVDQASAFLDTSVRFTSEDISKCFYGLSNLNSDWEPARRMLALLVSACLPNSVPVAPSALGTACYGLKRTRSDVESALAAVDAFAERMDNNSKQASEDHFTLSSLSQALYGLNMMADDSAEVRRMMGVLARRIRTAHEEGRSWNSQLLCMGLCYKVCDHADGRELLASIAEKIERHTVPFRAIELAEMITSLQRLSLASPEAIQLVSVLTAAVEQCTETFNGKSTALAITGLQCAGADKREVLSLLDAIHRKSSFTSAQMNAKSLGQVMLGLQGMSNETDVVGRVVSSVSALLAPPQNAQLPQKPIGLAANLTDLGRVVFGMRNMTCSQPAAAELLVHAVMELRAVVVDSSQRKISDLRSLIRQLLLSAPYIRNVEPGLRTLMFDCIAKLHVALSKRTPLEANPTEDALNDSENALPALDMRTISLFHEAFANRVDCIRVTGPTILHHFAADVVLNVIVSDGVEATVNIEFDSPKDFLALNSNFTQLRDSYLNDFHGVIVVRLRKGDLQEVPLERVPERIIEALISADIDPTLRDQIIGVLCKNKQDDLIVVDSTVEPESVSSQKD